MVASSYLLMIISSFCRFCFKYFEFPLILPERVVHFIFRRRALNRSSHNEMSHFNEQSFGSTAYSERGYFLIKTPNNYKEKKRKYFNEIGSIA